MENENSIIAQVTRFDDEALAKFVAELSPSDASLLLRQADQALAARLLSRLPVDVLVRLFAAADTSSLHKLLVHAHPAHLSRFISSTSTALFTKLLDAAPTQRQREKLIAALPQNRRDAVLRRIRAYEKAAHLEQPQESISHEPRARTSDLESVRNEDLFRILEHEKREIETRYNERLREFELERRVLQAREAELQSRLTKLEESQSRQVQQRIEAKVPEYVTAAVKLLEDRESIYRRKASLWNLQASVVLFVAIIGAAALSLYGIHYGPPVGELSWQALIFVSFKGILVLGVLGLWAKHAFTISNAYMHEAIKRSDRAHAINFGKLYLEVYGTAVERRELIDIFENWNINSDSAFAKANPSGFESGLIEKALDLIKAAKPTKDGG